MEKLVKRWTAAAMGRKGGKATGQCKSRGDSEYYRELGKRKKKGDTP